MQAFQVVGFKPVLTDNLSNGDCFFSAIYRSLTSRGLLPSVAGCLNLRYGSESEFIQDARNLVADRVIAGEAKNIYEAYFENFLIDVSSLKLQVSSAPGYLQRFIQKKIEEQKVNQAVEFYNYGEFASEIAKYVRTSGTWVGQLEVTIFKNLLKLCNVVMDIYSSIMPATNLPKRVGDTFYIYLYNVGEVHWKHFILQDPGVQITLSRNTRPEIMNSSWRGGKRRRPARNTRRKHKAQRKSHTRKH